MFSEKEIWDILAEVEDPEILVINVVEMGIVRGVEVVDDIVKVT